MNTHGSTNLSEAELLYRYVGEQLASCGRDTSLKQLLDGYVAYRRQLARLHATLREAEASSARGESAELDAERLIDEFTQELAAEGIFD
jgi:hypothetical protein